MSYEKWKKAVHIIIKSISWNEFSKEKNVILGNVVQIITVLLMGP